MSFIHIITITQGNNPGRNDNPGRDETYLESGPMAWNTM